MRTILYFLAISFAGLAGAQPVRAADPTSFFAANTPSSTMKIDHAAWGDVLARYIQKTANGINLFAYSKVSNADRQKLKAYLTRLQAISVRDLSQDEQMAFWINLYNAKTIDVVLDHYPVKSIRDISLGGGFFATGPWKKQNMIVEGQPLSLDNVEHDILRKLWREPRVHYAVNCASFSCPNLAAKPFTSKELEAMLDDGASAYVNHPRGVAFQGKRLILSEIFSWYRKDFGTTDAEIIAHISKFAAPKLREKLAGIKSIDGYAYDWSLNDAK